MIKYQGIYMEKQNKIFLYIAILIPIFMIVITFFSIHFFKVELHPQYNFIYMINNGDAYQCWQKMKKEIFPVKSTDQNTSTESGQNIDCSKAKLYEYDFTSKQSKLITLEQARKMKLSPPSQTISPDGFVINTYCYSSDISGWGLYSKSYSSVCIKKDDVRQKLNINYSNDYPDEIYYFYFISWVQDSNVTTPETRGNTHE